MSVTLAIVGRPNVGKSTLFNRLVGQKLALVDDQPGVTRDRRRHAARLQDLKFDVIDTAGLEEGDRKSLAGRMRQQTEMAIEEADATLFVVDARDGITPVDASFSALLRRMDKPIILVGNKAEAQAAKTAMYEAFELGLGEPVTISAEHGLGMSDLRDAIIEALGEDRMFEDDADDQDVAITDVDVNDEDFEDDKDVLPYDPAKPLRIAVVGRPNAGKSTLINTLLGEDRLLTGPEAGITRDSISVDWVFKERKIRLHDTAGMRRKARVQEKLEKLSVGDALRAIRFAEAVIVVLDSAIPFEKQDLQIIDLVVREGRAPVLAFNKWDAVEHKQQTLMQLREQTQRLLPQVRGIRAVPVSGKSGYGLDKLLDAVFVTDRVWNTRISTARLNKWLDGIVAHHPPPAVAGRRLKLKYITQAKTRPPGFVVSCSRPDAVPTAYTRYLTNNLREDFDMPGVPIRIHLRGSDNPFAGRAKKKR
ncbi:MAG: ribosome biogenesis GTPase Der [Pseudomonadota bacterium]